MSLLFHLVQVSSILFISWALDARFVRSPAQFVFDELETNSQIETSWQEELGQTWYDLDEHEAFEDSDTASYIYDKPLFNMAYKASPYDRDMETPRPDINDGRECVHGWDITNPSFIFKEQQVWAVFRGTCVVMESKYKRRWYSKLLFGMAATDALRMDNASWTWSQFLEARDPRFVDASPNKQECLLVEKDFSAGPEDPKLVMLNNKTYVIVTGLDTIVTPDVPSTEDDRPHCRENNMHGFLLHAYELNSVRPIAYGKGVKLTFEGMGMVEKNWNFFVHQKQPGMEELMAVYSVHPYTIVKLDLETGSVTKTHEENSTLVEQVAKGISMTPDEMHGGAGVARINEPAVADAIIWESLPHHCLTAMSVELMSEVKLLPCNRTSPLAQWQASSLGERGQILFAGRQGLCLDLVNGSLVVNTCAPWRLEQTFMVPPSQTFGKIEHMAAGHCIHLDYEVGDLAHGKLSVQWCDGAGEEVPEDLRLKRSFSFLGRAERKYFLSVFHSPAVGWGVPYRNWPYRFSMEPPFEILEIGSEITTYLFTSPNPAYSVPVQFVTSVVYDKPVDGDLGNVVVGYGSGDMTARTFRMKLHDFESTFFGVNNATYKPDPFGGAAAIVQKKREELMEQRREAKREREESRLAAEQAVAGTDALTGAEAAERNLCKDGHLIPELFILGAQVNFSTSLVNDLRSSPDMAFDVPGPQGGLQGMMQAQGASFLRGSQTLVDGRLSVLGTLQWTSGYPSCPSEKRQVVTETSVALLSREDAPGVISKLVEGTIHHTMIHFVVLLRDPRRRLQAAYRMHVELGDCAGQLPETLQGALDKLVQTGVVCDCPCDVIVPKTMDGKALSEYFKAFNSRQFEVIPFKVAVGEAFPRYIWDLVGVKHGQPASSATGAPRFRPLLPMRDFVEEETIERLTEYFEGRNAGYELNQVLANSDANLYDYTGRPHDSGDVESWLRESLLEEQW